MQGIMLLYRLFVSIWKRRKSHEEMADHGAAGAAVCAVRGGPWRGRGRCVPRGTPGLCDCGAGRVGRHRRGGDGGRRAQAAARGREAGRRVAGRDRQPERAPGRGPLPHAAAGYQHGAVLVLSFRGRKRNADLLQLPRRGRLGRRGTDWPLRRLGDAGFLQRAESARAADPVRRKRQRDLQPGNHGAPRAMDEGADHTGALRP